MRAADPIYTALGQRFLAVLADGAPRIPAYNVAVVVAHPDDETISCGATLKRLFGARVISVTNGAPAGPAACGATHACATARWRELLAALELAGHKPIDATGLAVSDRQAAEHLVVITRRLAHLFTAGGTAIALTHAYEGGHADHDSTAFAVHQAAGLCRREGQDVTVIEMPFYHAGENGKATQSFVAGESAEAITLSLSPESRELKERMIACFKSRAAVLTGFDTDAEKFRLAPSYDFEALPNDGRVLYDSQGTQLASRWPALVADARRRLSEDRAPKWPSCRA
jgi:LmbE family N-acetylglucosaminyl deacetylase